MLRSFDSLVEEGIYVIAGVDDDGEPLYALDPEVAKEKAPELYWAEKNAVDKAILDAIEEGYLDLEIDPATLEDTLIVTEKGQAA